MAASPMVRFRESLADPAVSLTHLQRLSNKIPEIRNPDPSTRLTSLALATKINRLDIVEWLMLDCDHDQQEISRVSPDVSIAILSRL